MPTTAPARPPRSSPTEPANRHGRPCSGRRVAPAGPLDGSVRCTASRGLVSNPESAPDRSAVSQRVAEFAWRVKNALRPRGLAALGLPCQLMGTGMAFPRDVLRSADLATGHLAEDLHLGLQLASIGRAPFFCPTAVVRSEHVPAAEIEFLRWRAERWMKMKHLPAAFAHSPWFVARNGRRMLHIVNDRRDIVRRDRVYRARSPTGCRGRRRPILTIIIAHRGVAQRFAETRRENLGFVY